MTFVKVEDDLPWHPKILAVGPEAAWLYVAGLCYCGQYLTDGHIPTGALGRLTVLDAPQAAMERLVQAELWHPNATGWTVHNYLERQTSREHVEHIRAQARARASRRRSAEVRANVARSNGEVREPEVQKTEVTPTRRKRRSATEAPDPFEITPAMRAWASEHALAVDLDRETDRLVDWAKGKGERKSDWLATWRNWMRRRADEMGSTEPEMRLR